MKKGRKVLATLSLVIFLCALAFVAYELFQVRKITVLGNETRSQDEIVTLSGLEYEKSIFLVDKQAALDALASDPYIKPVSIEFKYPDNVVITIEEREEAACIEKDNTYVIIDREGWVLRLATDLSEAEYAHVTGLPADTVEVGRQLGTRDTFKIGVLTRLLDAFDSAGITPTVIDVSLAADIVLTLPDGLFVEIGDDTQLDEKMKLMEASQKELAKEGRLGGVLDVSSVNNAYYR